MGVYLQPMSLRPKRRFKDADGVLLQLEIPLEAVRAAIELAKRHHVKVMLNPAPARTLPIDLLRLIDVLTPNESEAANLAGCADVHRRRSLAALASIRAESCRRHVGIARL